MRTATFLLLVIIGFSAQGQGCIPVRNIVGFGQFMNAGYPGFDTPGSWHLNVNARHVKIARSYVGSDERTNLPSEDERINMSLTMNIGIIHLLSDGWAVAMDFPIASNSRKTWQEHDPTNTQKIHHTVHSFGVGDIRITAYKWLLSTTKIRRGNIQVGLGLKFPTGDYKYQDYFHKATGKIVAPVNSTIQLGDGGTGFTTELNLYYNISGSISIYGNFFYLINPRDHNGVSSIDGGGTPDTLQVYAGDFTNSVPDSYSARAGLNFTAKKFVFSSGARVEGQPTYDLIGESSGTRRAGYTISIEPGISYKLRRSIVYLLIPLSIRRTTQQTVPDKIKSQVQGKYIVSSGGFADYMIFAGAVFRL